MPARFRLVLLLAVALAAGAAWPPDAARAAGPRDAAPRAAPDAPPDAGSGADPGQELQRQLSSRLPGGWKVSLPEDYLGVEQVTVQIPDAWRGSPAAAAVALCPDPDSAVWQGLPLLRLVVRYHGRDWPSYDCRP